MIELWICIYNLIMDIHNQALLHISMVIHNWIMDIYN